MGTGKNLVVGTGSTALGGTLSVTGAATLSSTLGVTGNATVGGTLGVTGTLTGATINATTALQVNGVDVVTKPWVGARVASAGTTIVAFGQSTITSISKTATGVYQFTIPAHPSGTNYTVHLTSHSSAAPQVVTVTIDSSTQFTVRAWTVAGAAVDAGFTAISYP